MKGIVPVVAFLLVPQALTAQDSIFADSFESGDLTAWTSVVFDHQFLPCVSTADCADGLVCGALEAGSGVCVRDCSSSPSVCSGQTYCDTQQEVISSIEGVPSGPLDLCWRIGGDGTPCLPGSPAEACLSGLSCIPTGIGLAHECRQVCPAGDIGGPSNCDPGELCLADTSGQIDGLEFTGTACSVNPDCDPLGSEYACILDSNLEQRCARLRGRCGTARPIQTSFDSGEFTDRLPNHDSEICRVANESAYCATLEGSATAPGRVECDPVYPTPIFFYLDPPSCDSNSSSFLCEALIGATCFDLQPPIGPSCGYKYSLCVAYCESSDGQETFACPAGQLCAEPADPTTFDVILQLDVFDNLVFCPLGTECNSAAGFSCLEEGVCARGRKVCQK